MKSALGGRFMEVLLIVAVVMVTSDRAGRCVANVLLDFFDVNHGWRAEGGRRKKSRAAEALCQKELELVADRQELIDHKISTAAVAKRPPCSLNALISPPSHWLHKLPIWMLAFGYNCYQCQGTALISSKYSSANFCTIPQSHT